VANSHFANFGDVWKHLPLAEVLRLRPAAQYWETHAGSAAYQLTHSLTRAHGALRFLAMAPTEPDLVSSAYFEALVATPGIYPGSSALARRELGTAARYLLCDLDADSAESLRVMGRDHCLDLRVVQSDGVSVIVSAANVNDARPSDVLVHIDPFDPFERSTPDALTPIALAGELARRGYRVFYWYGYESTAERGWARDAISRRAPEAQLWCGDMLVPSPFVFPDRPGAWGCGIVLANMTWAEAEACHRLGAALQRISSGDRLADNEPSAVHFQVI
jgi:23S rRNA A2030 N6-methylase RlmJ